MRIFRNDFLKITFLSLVLTMLIVCHTKGQNNFWGKAESNLKFNHLTTEHGLSSNVINCVFQDKDGYMWFGTDAGLNRYDGFKIKNYSYGPNVKNGLSNGVIKSLNQDRNGIIWIGTEWGLNRLDPVTDRITYHFSTEDSLITLTNNTISSIIEDKDSILWIGTFSGLNKLDSWTEDNTPIFKQFLHVPTDPSSLSNNRIYSIYCDTKNNLWIGTEGGGLNLLTEKSRKTDFSFINFRHKTETPNSISNNIIYSINEDSTGNIYVGTDTGFNVISMNNGDTTINSYMERREKKEWLQENRIFSIIPDTPLHADGSIHMNKKMWLGTYGSGLNLFDPKNETFTSYKKDFYDPQSLSRNYIYSLYVSKDRILWLATRDTGIDFINPENQRFIHLKYLPNNPNSLSNTVVKSIVEDNLGRFWFGTFGGGLNRYDPSSGSFLAYTHNSNDPNSISSDIVESLCFDYDGRLWVGTSGGLCLFDEKTKQFTRYKHDPTDPNSLPNDYIWNISVSKKKDGLWLATHDGLSKFDWNKNKFFHFKNNPADPNSLSYNFLRAAVEDDQNNLWVCTFGGGLNKLDLTANRNLSNAKFEHFRHTLENPESISNDLINIFFIDSKGHYWVGTQGGLNKFDPRKGTFKAYTVNDGLVDNVVKGILEDNDGNLWISTQNGLSKFDPEKGAFYNYYKKDGLQADVFTLSSCYKNSRGEMMFGGVDGVSIFKAENIKERIITPPVQIDEISINNIKISPSLELNGRILIDKSISRMDEIHVKHDENVITLEYTAIEYSSPEMLEFSYQLEGVDKQWNYAAFNERQVTYSGLGAGEYLFRLRATNKNSTWGQQEKQLKIIVYPPFWATNLAYLIYIAIFIGIAYIIYFNVRNQIQIKRELAVEKEAHRREMEIEEFKLRFFTNISHDIKTPLTLISVPLQRMIKEYAKISNAQRERYFNTMNKSVQMLIRLVNQLMYFRKIENKKLLLEVSEGDLAAYLRNDASSFIDLAEEKNIYFKVDIPTAKKQYWFDPKIIDKIFFNLLSNAFKFTPVGGTITVKFLENKPGSQIESIKDSNDQEYTGFSVSDTGIGIPDEKINIIFKRFEQLKSGKEMGVGTGIGLAIVKRLVDIHKGHIEVESTPGTGSAFTIWIPANKLSYKSSEINENPEIDISMQTEAEITNSDLSIAQTPFVDSSSQDTKESSKKIKILVVEDYSEMRSFIKDILKGKYQVSEAENGKEGYEKALLDGPDLIITDVMMPEMSGLELCKKIKKNVNISHIPVIMLTARNTVENEIEGLETGANYFIKKPFNIDQLQLVVKNTLDYRRELQLKFSGNKIPEPKDVNVTSVDEKFLTTASEVLEENISNSEFSVEDLARQTGLSPVHLYRKFKFLTGMSSNDFIKTFRMKRAAQLLQKNKLRISEVAYAVGFNDPRYFRKCFKAEFGKSPTDYVNDSKAESE